MTVPKFAQVQDVLQRVLLSSKADETQVTFEAARMAVTRFARNAISQNTCEDEATVTMRAAFGKRVGSASTDDLSPAGLARAIEWLESAARLQPENPEWPGLPEPQPLPRVNAFDNAAAEATSEYGARAVLGLCRRAQAAGLMASGAYTIGSGAFAVANSRGLVAYHPYSDVELTLVLESETGSGYAQGVSWRLDRVDLDELCLEAMGRARRPRAPRPIEPGEYPVVLEPYAVLSLVEALAEAGMGALAVQEGRSWMNRRIGRTVLSPAVSIWDDGLDQEGNPMPFDHEGVPKRRVEIVHEGVPVGPVYDTLTASREPGRTSTGHAQPYDEDWDGPAPENLCLAPGAATVADMIAGLDRGLYITRLWYTNLISERDCAVTGVSRDGMWWIQDGELSYPVTDLRFTERLVPALGEIRAVGNRLKTVRGTYGTHRLPALALDSFRFVPPASGRAEEQL